MWFSGSKEQRCKECIEKGPKMYHCVAHNWTSPIELCPTCFPVKISVSTRSEITQQNSKIYCPIHNFIGSELCPMCYDSEISSYRSGN